MYGPDKLPADVKDKCSVPVYTFDDFLKLGKDVPDADIQARSKGCKTNQTCTLIYTSGTTGPPKAVMITHDNITWTVRSMLATTPKETTFPTDSMVSYLPLSHIAAQMLDMHMPMETGCQIYFAQPDALKGSLVETLKEVRPTYFFGVPRVWEKIYGTILCLVGISLLRLLTVTTNSRKVAGSCKIEHRGQEDALDMGEETGATALGISGIRVQIE
mmetsp:Transcript_28317/g.65636  ORF Transcript_28317/g.65636 Transcript_28317/m.65636 type:complete len:216 (+) Transcript_28317:387-1034(+)